MAQSAASSAVDLLVESRDSYSSVLSLFQQNHDLILRSGLFAISSSFITSLDQSATSFQSLGHQTVSLASKISDQWIDEVISFYDDLPNNAHSENVRKLESLGGQTKKLGRVFEVIAEWSRDLAGRVHTANEKYKKENFVVLSYAVFETAGMSSSVEISIVTLTAAATGALAAAKATYSESQAQQQIEDDYQSLKNSFDGQSVVGKRQVYFNVCPVLGILIKIYFFLSS